MDIYLDTLLQLPYITIDSRREVDSTIFFKLNCLNQTIDCPDCGAKLDRINQSEEVLIRDLPVFGKPVDLQVPHRQFHCLACQKFRTERLEFVRWRHHQTRHYEQAIYEQVKPSRLEEVSRREGLGVATVRAIFDEYATGALKKPSSCPNG